MERKRLSLSYIQIGSTGSWGHPINLNHEHLFPNYSAEIFDKIEAHALDTVLIDGRFRVACILQTIINCYRNKNLQILVHDFSIRPEYHEVLKYLDKVVEAETLGVFQIKKDIDIDAVKKDYELFKFNPA